MKESRKADKSRELEFLIDSGAVHSLVPAEILRELGIEAYKDVMFVLADGNTVMRRVGDAYIEYDGYRGGVCHFR